MANGDMNVWLKTICQIGLPTAAVCVLCFVVWTCTIVPFTEERAFLLDTLKESVASTQATNESNQQSLKTIADATGAMAENSSGTRDLIESLDKKMGEFTGNVSQEHATAQESLDAIQADTEQIIQVTKDVQKQLSGGT